MNKFSALFLFFGMFFPISCTYNHNSSLEMLNNHKIILSKTDSVKCAPFGHSPFSIKCIANDHLYYLNDEFGQQCSFLIPLKNNGRILSDTVTIPNDFRKWLVNHGIIRADLERRFQFNQEYKKYKSPRLALIVDNNNKIYKIIRVHALEKDSLTGSIMMNSFELMVDDNENISYIDPIPLFRDSADFDPETLYIGEGDSLWFGFNRSFVHHNGDNPLFVLFTKASDERRYLPHHIYKLKLPGFYMKSTGSRYLNSGGIVRKHYFISLMVPVIYDLETGNHFEYCNQISNSQCFDLLANPGTHYWLSDARYLSSNRMAIAYEKDETNYLSVLDMATNTIEATIMFPRKLSMGTSAFTSDSTIIGLAKDINIMYRWKFFIK